MSHADAPFPQLQKMAAQRILVVEDEPGSRAALSNLLAGEGYTVCTAGTGRAALERVADFHPDTIVCDFDLPDIDGLGVLRSVRAGTGDGVMFIVMTGGSANAEAETTLRSEADFYFPKPVDLPMLRWALRQPSGRTADQPVNQPTQSEGEFHGRT